MKLHVNGYNHITSKKDNKQYTIVHCMSDIPFENGDGFQNMELFLAGHRTFKVGAWHDAVTEQYLFNGNLTTKVSDLQIIKE